MGGIWSALTGGTTEQTRRSTYYEEDHSSPRYHYYSIAGVDPIQRHNTSTSSNYSSYQYENSRESQDQRLFDSKCTEEKKANAFSVLYTTPHSPPPPDPKAPPLSAIQNLLRSYTHSAAIKFAAKSWVWKKNNSASTIRTLPRDNSASLVSYASEPSGLAYYRVISEEPNSYILVACHANVHGFHRGDLRFLEVNDKTQVKGLSEKSVVGHLFVGDVVAINELALLTTDGFQSHVLNTSQDGQCTWMVKNMTLLNRTHLKNCTFALLENGSAVVKGENELLNVKASNGLQLETLYEGNAFVPQKMLSHFTEDIDPKLRNSMVSMTSSIYSYPTAFGTIYAHWSSVENNQKFAIGTNAFKTEADEEYNEGVVELCALMGYSAANSMFNGRQDWRSLLMMDVKREGLNVKFSIDNPLKQPTEGRWCSNNRIKFGGRCGEINGTIETVTVDRKIQQLRITARIPRGTPKNFDFKDGIHIVQQREPLDIKTIEEGFFVDLRDDDNGKKIITALYGGPKLGGYTVRKKNIYFPGQPKTMLNEYQAEYVSMILGESPLVIGNSPFGCGKSMTIVTAALEVWKNSETRSQQLLITQSNYASVNLVDIARKIRYPSGEKGPLFVRYKRLEISKF